MFEDWASFLNIAGNHLVLIAIYTILALSLNLINGSLGAFSLGHHAFWGMGAYAAGAWVWTQGSPDGSAWVFASSFPVGILFSAAFGLLVGVPCLRLRGDYLAIATLGFAEIFVICARNSETWTVFNARRGLGGAAGFSLGDDHMGGNDYVQFLLTTKENRLLFYLFLAWLSVAAVFTIIRNLLHSAHGRAILAIRDDETAAELLGVNLTRYKVLAFVVGAAFAGWAGALYANFRPIVLPAQFQMMEGIKVLLMVVLGGLGSLSGTLLAVPLLYISEQALGTLQTEVPFVKYEAGAFVVVDKTLKDLWQVLFPLFLVLVMLLRPEGIMGRREFSRAYFHQIWTNWREDWLPPVLTLLQWGQLVWTLACTVDPWVLLASIAVAIGIQVFKKRRREARRAARVAGGDA